MIRELNPSAPVHNGLWNSGFVMLAVAGLLLTVSAYMLMALMPLHISERMATNGVVCQEQLISAAAYAVGLFAFGPFCNWLVQRYRRGTVCVRAIEGYSACAILSWFFLGHTGLAMPVVVEVLRFLTAAFYGLAIMVLLGTLVVDKTDSCLRTCANHSAAWLARLGLALGPLLAVVLYRNATPADVCLWASVAGVAAAVLVRLVRFPFKTPEDDLRHVSTDRFFLADSLRTFLFTAVCYACYGFVLAVVGAVAFYALVLVGFLWAMVSERFIPSQAYRSTDLFIAFVFILSAMSLFCSPNGVFPGFFTPCLLGAGVGMAGARSQLLLINECDHCRRSTAVDTFVLASEFGVAIGVLAGLVALTLQLV